MIWIVVAFVVIVAIVFSIAPYHSGQRADDWRGVAFAHRGLHGNGVPENTLDAFERACQVGFGIELDVQLSSDDALVVFHDDSLQRMTGDPRRVDEVPLHELRRLSVGEISRIPTLSEALRRINGRVPLLVEIKNSRHNTQLCAKTVALLRTYDGPYIVESFNPFILRRLRKLAPEIIRGQLVSIATSYLAYTGRISAFLLSRLILNFLGRPDFIAYDVNSTRLIAPRVQRKLFHTPMAAWTIRDQETYQASLARNEMPIFEGFIPDDKGTQLTQSK